MKLNRTFALGTIFFLAVLLWQHAALHSEDPKLGKDICSIKLTKGFENVGCFVDVDFLPTKAANSNTSPLACLHACKPLLASLSVAGCACGSDETLTRPVPATECHLLCGGLNCGGYFASNVYRAAHVSQPTPTVNVVLCSEGDRLRGAMAAINSVKISLFEVVLTSCEDPRQYSSICCLLACDIRHGQ